MPPPGLPSSDGRCWPLPSAAWGRGSTGLRGGGGSPSPSIPRGVGPARREEGASPWVAARRAGGRPRCWGCRVCRPGCPPHLPVPPPPSSASFCSCCQEAGLCLVSPSGPPGRHNIHTSALQLLETYLLRMPGLFRLARSCIARMMWRECGRHACSPAVRTPGLGRVGRRWAGCPPQPGPRAAASPCSCCPWAGPCAACAAAPPHPRPRPLPALKGSCPAQAAPAAAPRARMGRPLLVTSRQQTACMSIKHIFICNVPDRSSSIKKHSRPVAYFIYASAGTAHMSRAKWMISNSPTATVRKKSYNLAGVGDQNGSACRPGPGTGA